MWARPYRVTSAGRSSPHGGMEPFADLLPVHRQLHPAHHVTNVLSTIHGRVFATTMVCGSLRTNASTASPSRHTDRVQNVRRVTSALRL